MSTIKQGIGADNKRRNSQNVWRCPLVVRGGIVHGRHDNIRPQHRFLVDVMKCKTPLSGSAYILAEVNNGVITCLHDDTINFTVAVWIWLDPTCSVQSFFFLLFLVCKCIVGGQKMPKIFFFFNKILILHRCKKKNIANYKNYIIVNNFSVGI